MITISNVPFHETMTDLYYQYVLRENIEYLEKHGKSIYEYNGRFANRTRPWLDSSYWMRYKKWLKDEFNITQDDQEQMYTFETEEEMIWFTLRYS